MAFGPESNNPRERRAYAHALISKATETHRSADKIQAVEAAAAASKTQKGRGLGEQAIRTMVNMYTGYSPTNTVRSPEHAENNWGIASSWLTGEFVDASAAIEHTLGVSAGMTIVKPKTHDEYRRAAEILGCGISGEQYAIAKDASFLQYDTSVPGVGFRKDVLHALVREPLGLIYPDLQTTTTQTQ